MHILTIYLVFKTNPEKTNLCEINYSLNEFHIAYLPISIVIVSFKKFVFLLL